MKKEIGWLLVVVGLLLVVLLSLFCGVWGFGGSWLGLGLVALVLFLASGGKPWGLFDGGALVASGLLGFALIINELVDETPQSTKT